jgi:hypothetical protein
LIALDSSVVISCHRDGNLLLHSRVIQVIAGLMAEQAAATKDSKSSWTI